MLAAACAGQDGPTSPDPLPDTLFSGSLEGTWRGYAQPTECAGAPCGDDDPWAFVLSAARAADGSFIAALELKPPFGWEIELTGTPQSDGAVLFSGVRDYNAADPASHSQILISGRVGADPAAGLGGSVEMTSVYGKDRRTSTFRILSASYEPTNLSTPGRWRGYAMQRTCTGSCPSSPYDVPLALTLWQNGSGGAGTLDGSFGGAPSPAALTGTLGASSASLTGRSGPGVTEQRIERLDVTINAVGRMKGRLRVAVTTQRYNQTTKRTEKVSYRVDSDIYLAREW